jgi:hypothetical protein
MPDLQTWLNNPLARENEPLPWFISMFSVVLFAGQIISTSIIMGVRMTIGALNCHSSRSDYIQPSYYNDLCINTNGFLFKRINLTHTLGSWHWEGSKPLGWVSLKFTVHFWCLKNYSHFLQILQHICVCGLCSIICLHCCRWDLPKNYHKLLDKICTWLQWACKCAIIH